MEYDDTVTLAPGLVIKSQSIGVASNATGFDEEDGILGIGPVDLTNGTVSKAPTVPTVTDNLFKAGAITSDAIGIFYSPAAGKGGGSGELTWGGVDTTKIVGAINYVPITKTAPAKRFWGVDQTVTYKGKTIVPLSAGMSVRCMLN
jgi:pepsin A